MWHAEKSFIFKKSEKQRLRKIAHTLSDPFQFISTLVKPQIVKKHRFIRISKDKRLPDIPPAVQLHHFSEHSSEIRRMIHFYLLQSGKLLAIWIEHSIDFRTDKGVVRLLFRQTFPLNDQ